MSNIRSWLFFIFHLLSLTFYVQLNLNMQFYLS